MASEQATDGISPWPDTSMVELQAKYEEYQADLQAAFDEADSIIDAMLAEEPSQGPPDPCRDVTTGDLDYDSRGGMRHIFKNHISSDPDTAGKSKYVVRPAALAAAPTKELMQNVVKKYNSWTFQFGKISRDPYNGNVIIAYALPHGALRSRLSATIGG